MFCGVIESAMKRFENLNESFSSKTWGHDLPPSPPRKSGKSVENIMAMMMKKGDHWSLLPELRS
jgi:hypothetical protein